ncbi:hypothetical protein SORBI_3004G070150 [Sorghum bicolor]|uniref:Uncharacterized protein n=1 Tax=Sorghum bicolor TaxID=4558 RepID=A0A1Z5RLR1_SORBI|nr:hypothetical protein SORBI_3004G070150 [Sorghum bicolor]
MHFEGIKTSSLGHWKFSCDNDTHLSKLEHYCHASVTKGTGHKSRGNIFYLFTSLVFLPCTNSRTLIYDLRFRPPLLS